MTVTLSALVLIALAVGRIRLPVYFASWAV
jgi:hypothetical protein